jgi:lipopolysaccharide biosynthesis glycosyltransferase
MLEYARTHGYESSLHNISIHGSELESYFKGSKKRKGWIKISAILEALKGDEEKLLWLDIDVLVAKSEVSILDDSRPYKDQYLVWHDLEEYSHPSHYNTGVMLIKNCTWSKDFFIRFG